MTIHRTGKFLLVVFSFLITYVTVTAQQSERCGSVEAQNRLLQKDPTLAARLAAVRQQIQQYAAEHPAQHQRSTITIPIVVHVVSNGEAVGTGANISDAQVLSEIDVLNADYRRLNSDTANTPAAFKSVAADFEIEFCMAVRDPNGMATTGIDRINGQRASWTETDVDDNLKPSTTWNSAQYLNIWTVKLGGTSASVLGYAIMPGNDPSVDGVVIGYQYFGNTGSVTAPYNKGRTSTHEIGHWLGLYHTWSQFGDATTASCSDDDGIADTPNQNVANYGCPAFPHVSCSNGPNGDMFMNYMDYVDDGCMNLFTLGQKASILATLNTFRTAIKTSQACTRFSYDAAIREVRLPSTKVCDVNFRPLVKLTNEGSATLTNCILNSVIDGSGLQQQTWSGSLASGESEYVTMQQITTTTGLHTIDLFTSGPNNHTDENMGNDSKTVNFTVLSNAPGNALPLAQGFEDGLSLPTGWALDSIGADTVRWRVTDITGSGSNSSVWMNNFAGTNGSNSNGRRDYLILPPLYLPVSRYPHLTFDVAYARRKSTSQDSLAVSYSIDCGTTWYRLYAKGGATLQTVSDTLATAFVPFSSDWRHEDLVMPEVNGQDRVLIRFENYSNWGNNIYLDNININEFRVGVAEVAMPTISAIIAPNPSTGKFVATFSYSMPEHSSIQVFDLIGRQVYYSNAVSGSSFEIDLTGKEAGLYLVKISNGTNSIVKKVVIH